MNPSIDLETLRKKILQQDPSRGLVPTTTLPVANFSDGGREVFRKAEALVRETPMGLPFTAERRRYVELLNELHRIKIDWVREYGTTLVNTTRIIDGVALREVLAVANTILKRTLALEEIQVFADLQRARMDLYQKWVDFEHDLQAKAQQWAAELVLDLYERAWAQFRMHADRLEAIARQFFSFGLQTELAPVE